MIQIGFITRYSTTKRVVSKKAFPIFKCDTDAHVAMHLSLSNPNAITQYRTSVYRNCRPMTVFTGYSYSFAVSKSMGIPSAPTWDRFFRQSFSLTDGRLRQMSKSSKLFVKPDAFLRQQLLPTISSMHLNCAVQYRSFSRCLTRSLSKCWLDLSQSSEMVF